MVNWLVYLFFILNWLVSGGNTKNTPPLKDTSPLQNWNFSEIHFVLLQESPRLRIPPPSKWPKSFWRGGGILSVTSWYPLMSEVTQMFASCVVHKTAIFQGVSSLNSVNFYPSPRNLKFKRWYPLQDFVGKLFWIFQPCVKLVERYHFLNFEISLKI